MGVAVRGGVLFFVPNIRDNDLRFRLIKMKMPNWKPCKCADPIFLDFDPVTCHRCFGKSLKGLHIVRDFDRKNGIIRDKDGKATNLFDSHLP